MRILIGNTGLIGQTLSSEWHFDCTFNSSSIHEFEKKAPENSDLYLSCLPATKYLVNRNIIQDIENITSILKQIQKIKYNKVFLFSTIDVYLESPKHSNEDTIPTINTMNYGSNRYIFERLVQQKLTYTDLKIIRLPGLFGNFLKKNVLFDLKNSNNLDQINLNSRYQWYYLQDLVSDIEAIEKNPHTQIFNLFTEPVSTQEIVDLFFPQLKPLGHYGNKIDYDYKTKTTTTGYWKSSDYVLNALQKWLR